MQALEFCLLFSRLEKRLGLALDSGIVSYIYRQYRGTYSNYTLFELVDMLECKGIAIDCALNKGLIIDMIRRLRIGDDVIPKQDLAIPMRPTEWFVAKDMCVWDYVIFRNTTTYMGMCCNDVICMGNKQRYCISDVYICPPMVRFGDGLAFDISEIYKNVQPLGPGEENNCENVVSFDDGNSFDICDIYNLVQPWDGSILEDYMLVVSDLETKKDHTFKLKEFMQRLDEEDVTYETHCFNIRHCKPSQAVILQ
jgi:hypothetical protein